MVTKREEEAQDVTDLDVALCAAALGGVVLIAPLVPFPELSFSRLFLVAVSLVVADALVLSLNWAGVCDGYTMLEKALADSRVQAARATASDVYTTVVGDGRPRARAVVYHITVALLALLLGQFIAHFSLFGLVLLGAWWSIAIPRLSTRFPTAVRVSANLVRVIRSRIPTSPALDGDGSDTPPMSDEWVVVGSSDVDGAASPTLGARTDGADEVKSPMLTPPVSSTETTPNDSGATRRDRGWSLLEDGTPAGGGRDRGWSLLQEDTPAPRRSTARSSLTRGLEEEDEPSELSNQFDKPSKLTRERGWSLLEEDENAAKARGGAFDVPKITPQSCLFSENFDVPALGSSTPAAGPRRRGGQVSDLDSS